MISPTRRVTVMTIEAEKAPPAAVTCTCISGIDPPVISPAARKKGQWESFKLGGNREYDNLNDRFYLRFYLEKAEHRKERENRDAAQSCL